MNISKTDDSSPNMKTNTPKTETHISKGIIFGVYVFITITIGIIGAAFRKEQEKSKGNFIMH